jgi:phage-related holin
MPKKSQNNSKKLFDAGVILFAAVVAGCLSYLFWDATRTHEIVCSVKMVDQITGLVKLDCAR